MAADARLADRIDVVDGGAEPDRLHDRRRASLKLVWRIAVDDAIFKDLADHLTAAIEGRHGVKVGVLAVKHADPGWAVELVAGESVEVAVDVLHVDVEMHRALGAVDEHRDAARM